MSKLTTHTTASRDSHSIGLCKFNTTSNAIEVSDGNAWQVYDPDTVTGWSGSNTYSLNFDGTDDYLTGSPVTPTAQQGTISAWVKTTTGGPIFSWSNIDYNPPAGTTKPQLTILGSGQLDFLYQQQHSGNEVNRIRSTSTINDGDWHHVAVTSNGSSWALYIDGSPASSTVPTGSNTGQWVGDIYNTNPAFVAFSDIGASRRNPTIGGSGYFQGNIDEVAIWDSALSSSQISTIHSSGPGNLLPLNPKAWWRMGDGVEANSGTTVYDMSSFSNNMTIVNATGGSNASGADYQTDTP